MKSPRSLRRSAAHACVYLALMAAGARGAGISIDNTLGPGGALLPDNTGNFSILPGRGVQFGGNLFLSFDQFNLLMGQAATFSGPNGLANILARVTGGPSSIDGTIRSTVDGAHLFLINPAGVMFGEHAAVDVKGSFTVTTANYVKLGSSGRFDASTPAASVLTSDPVSAWGFLNDGPSGIGLLDGATGTGTFKVADGGTLAFIGGDLFFQNSTLTAPGGRLELAAFSLAGEYAADLIGARGGASIGMLNTDADLSGPVGGSAIIRAGSLTLQRSRIVSTTTGSGRGGDFDVRVEGTMKVTGVANDPAKFLTQTSGSGQAGKVTIRAGRLRVEGGGSRVGSLALDSATGTARAGNVKVVADRVAIKERGRLESTTNGAAASGLVNVKTRELSIRGDASEIATGIFSDTTMLSADGTGGAAGGVRVNADSMLMTNGAVIESSTSGLGLGGDVEVRAIDIFIAAPNVKLPGPMSGLPNPSATGIFADTGSFTALGAASGAGGTVRVFADEIHIADGGLISTKTLGQGRAGDTIVETGLLEISRGKSDFYTGIAADSPLTNSGPGGNATVHAETIRLMDGGQISANTAGTGTGGNVSVEASDIEIVGRDDGIATGILAESDSAGADGGKGGDVQVVTERLQIRDGGRISTSTFGGGKGGDLMVRAGDVSISRGASPNFTGLASVTVALVDGGPGGRVRLEANTLQIADGGAISASSLGSGAGGSVEVIALQLSLDRLGFIEASGTGTGVAGSVSIDVVAPLTLSGGSAIRTTSAISSAGEITVTSASDITLDGSSITVTALTADAGLITLAAPGLIFLVNGGAVLAEAGLNGGNVSLVSRFGILDLSRISANAVLGAGGNILIIGESFLASSSPVTASSQASVQGTVVIQSPDAQLANALTPLPAGLVGANVKLSERCAIRLGADFSSFLVVGRGGTSLTPDEPQR